MLMASLILVKSLNITGGGGGYYRKYSFIIVIIISINIYKSHVLRLQIKIFEAPPFFNTMQESMYIYCKSSSFFKNFFKLFFFSLLFKFLY